MMPIKLPEDTLKYLGIIAVVFGSWLGAYVWGIHLGSVQSQRTHTKELAECVMKIDEVHAQLTETRLELTECQAVNTGECTLNCEATIQRRVNSVLQEVTCEN